MPVSRRQGLDQRHLTRDEAIAPPHDRRHAGMVPRRRTVDAAREDFEVVVEDLRDVQQVV